MAFGVGESRVCLVCEVEGVVPVRECPEGCAEEEQGGHGGGGVQGGAECRCNLVESQSRLSPFCHVVTCGPPLNARAPRSSPPNSDMTSDSLDDGTK